MSIPPTLYRASGDFLDGSPADRELKRNVHATDHATALAVVFQIVSDEVVIAPAAELHSAKAVDDRQTRDGYSLGPPFCHCSSLYSCYAEPPITPTWFHASATAVASCP